MLRQENEYEVPEVEEMEGAGATANNVISLEVTRFKRAMRSIFPREQTEEEESLDVARAKKGDIEARNRLLAANAWIILFVVQKVINSGTLFRSGILEVQDLLHEGQLGVFDAVGRFNKKAGVRFATYAAYRVMDYVMRAVGNAHPLSSTSRSLSRRVSYLKKRRDEVAAKLGREPTHAELYIGLSKSKQHRLAEAELFASWISSGAAIPMDDFEETYWSDSSADVEAIVSRKEQEERLQNLIDSPDVLKLNERMVVRMRYFAGGEDEVGYLEIAAYLGVCKSRVCQLNTSAIKKLRKRF